jgi:two-component system heavy metal sensor histidine kinase CusS
MRWPPSDILAGASLRIRLTALNTAVVLVVTAATLFAVRFAARATLYDDADAELRGGAQEVVLALRDMGPDLNAVIAEMRRKAASQEQRGWFMHLVTENGTTLWKSVHCPEEVASYPPARLNSDENIVQVGPYRYVRLRIAQPGGHSYHVRVGTYTTGLDDRLSGLLRFLIVLGAILLFLAPLAAYWLAGRATRPVADILTVANRLSPTKMGDRLAVRGTHDELDRLSHTINGLLDDVAEHVERQEQFVADAAHELRGPLAAIRSSLEVGLAHDQTVEQCQETFTAVLEETRYLSKLANDLLALAEAAAMHHDLPSGLVDVTAIARQAVDMFAGVADERGVDLIIAPCEFLSVQADAAQLRQVIGNLLDNAIRFTPRGGRVNVELTRDREQGSAVLTVSDSGVGIAAEHVGRLFDRFYKVDPSRTRDADRRSGGLGLPICRAIVARHGGTIAVASRLEAGTTVTVRLPLALPAQPPQPPVPPLVPALG